MKSRLLLNAALLSVCSHASALDVIPGQGIAPPPDLNLFMASYVDIDFGEIYQQSNRLPGAELDVDLLLLRYARSFSVGDMPAAAYIQSGFGQSQGKGSLGNQPDSKGIADTAFAFAVWPYADHENGDYLALAGFLSVPTGKYDSNQLINVGKNRYSAILQAGYQARINDDFDYMIATDVQWYADNDDSPLQHKTLKTDPLYSGQISLMYTPSQRTIIAGSLFVNHGAENSLDGVSLNDDVHLERWQVSASQVFPFGKLILQYGGDLNTDNDNYQDHKAILRYQYVWK